MGVEEVAEEFGVNAYMTGGTDWSTDGQIQIIEDLITKGVDGLSIMAPDPAGLDMVFKKALNAGIPVNTHNVDAPESGRFSYVGANFFRNAVATAEGLIQYMGSKGKVLMSTVDASAVWSQEREAGVRSIINEDTYPDIEILPLLNIPNDEQTNYAAHEAALQANPDITGFISLGATDELFSRLLKNENMGNVNSDNPIYNTGHDLYEAKLILMQEGWCTVAIGQNPRDQGYFAAKQLYDFLITGDPEVFVTIDTGILWVDENNVDEILERLYAGEPIG